MLRSICKRENKNSRANPESDEELKKPVARHQQKGRLVLYTRADRTNRRLDMNAVD